MIPTGEKKMNAIFICRDMLLLNHPYFALVYKEESGY